MPSDAGVQFNLGRLYETTQRPAEAIEAYRRFLAAGGDPRRNATAHLKLARLLAEQRRLEDAVAEYRAFLQEVPERHEVRYELATSLAAASRYPEALAEYEKVFAAGGGDADGLARAGAICLLTRDLPRAVDYLDRAVRKDPSLVPARLSLGTALAQSGEHARAVEVLQTVATDEPDNERVHHLLGQSLQKLGRAEEARQAFERHRLLHERILKERMSGEPQGHP
jgi:tetratricopeptide (TPR) repeat protein